MPVYLMPESSRRAAPQTAAHPAADSSPAPDPEVTLRSSLRGTGKVKRFALRLKTNGQRIKKFLDGGK